MKAALSSGIDEARTLTLLRQGDRDAFAQWVSENQRGIFCYCLRMTGSQEDAEDLTQEVFIKAYRGIQKFREQSLLSTWLYQIAHNTCVDYLRRQKKGRMLSIQAAMEERPGRDPVPDAAPLPEQRAVHRENIETLKECLQTLSRTHRAATLLRHTQHMSYQEIADVMKLPLGTVKSHISRARQHLRDCMTEKGVSLGEEVG
jgi:RNA polymerase sigma-70 factor (ECF subfamily)